jgi:uncharacterized membrane protein
MFVLGGLCFLVLGHIAGRIRSRLLAALAGAGAVTAMELACGLLVNRRFQIWDYRQMPLNYRGQICLPYVVLWIPVCMLALWLYEVLEGHLFVDFSR